ncbi:hypothetical protein [Pseudoalteromonas sp. S16_S37]|uniref:hypothetical protein n=1 Tax=Pseudoalteromonas sp. S16_S37 TaxID=2720228 RepID=UPI001681B139|nr:hypothetical protein [Pseudoalteromonas sp. S16_S37]MBD1584888.1 hypothetical protein [Pseudoalteromonas sp. S16_S37]
MFGLLYLAILTITLVFLVVQVFKHKSTPIDKARREVEKEVQKEFQIKAHQLAIDYVKTTQIAECDVRYNSLQNWKENAHKYYIDYNAQVAYEMEQLNVVKIGFKFKESL